MVSLFVTLDTTGQFDAVIDISTQAPLEDRVAFAQSLVDQGRLVQPAALYMWRSEGTAYESNKARFVRWRMLFWRVLHSHFISFTRANDAPKCTFGNCSLSSALRLAHCCTHACMHHFLPSPRPAVESSPPLDKDAPLCSKSLSITRSFCLATDWATRSPLAYKAGTLATKADPLTSFLAANARWAGCGTNYGICAAAISAASALDVSDTVADDAAKAGALFSSFGLAPSLALQGGAGGNLTAGVLMEVCPPSPRTSLYNVSRVLAAALPGRRCSVVVRTRCGAVGLGFSRVDRISCINFTRARGVKQVGEWRVGIHTRLLRPTGYYVRQNFPSTA